MAQLTIQVSDELANRLKPILHRLPELLLHLVEINTLERLELTGLTNSTATYTKVLDFLIKQPTPQEIAQFKVSSAAQTRLQNLLEKNRTGTITQTEADELDVFEQLDQLMMLLKARSLRTRNSL